MAIMILLPCHYPYMLHICMFTVALPVLHDAAMPFPPKSAMAVSECHSWPLLSGPCVLSGDEQTVCFTEWDLD